jgi:hypothetical protein
MKKKNDIYREMDLKIRIDVAKLIHFESDVDKFSPRTKTQGIGLSSCPML